MGSSHNIVAVWASARAGRFPLANSLVRESGTLLLKIAQSLRGQYSTIGCSLIFTFHRKVRLRLGSPLVRASSGVTSLKNWGAFGQKWRRLCEVLQNIQQIFNRATDFEIVAHRYLVLCGIDEKTRQILKLSLPVFIGSLRKNATDLNVVAPYFLMLKACLLKSIKRAFKSATTFYFVAPKNATDFIFVAPFAKSMFIGILPKKRDCFNFCRSFLARQILFLSLLKRDNFESCRPRHEPSVYRHSSEKARLFFNLSPFFSATNLFLSLFGVFRGATTFKLVAFRPFFTMLRISQLKGFLTGDFSPKRLEYLAITNYHRL